MSDKFIRHFFFFLLAAAVIAVSVTFYQTVLNHNFDQVEILDE